jgi:hypothetical protein
MFYKLRHDLHHCFAGHSVIFLDLIENRYFALSPVCGDAFRRLVDLQGEAASDSHYALSQLIDRGYLVESSSNGSKFTQTEISPATSDFENGKLPRLHFPTFLLALYWEAIVSRRLRRYALSAVIKHAPKIRGQYVRSSEEAKAKTQQIATSFAYTALILGRTNRCLVRSLAMYSLCRSLGISIQLVIGVRSDPFAAHAWVQDDGLVLNDGIEQVGYYSPIMVLR